MFQKMVIAGVGLILDAGLGSARHKLVKEIVGYGRVKASSLAKKTASSKLLLDGEEFRRRRFF